jgi:peptidylprolyl isomerase
VLHLGAAALLAALLLGLAGCGGDDDEAEPAATGTAETAPAEAAPPADAAGGKPSVEVPDEIPKKLQSDDLKKGKGRAAKKGDTVSVHYVGVAASTGEEFDASWDRGQPFSFALGAQQVIPGWDRGVAGMRVGGRRRLVIPPDLAYGEEGAPPAIGPNETLVFVIDLLEIQ